MRVKRILTIKLFINSHSYIHAIIEDPDCNINDLDQILSINQIIELVQDNRYHNEEMSSDLALSIRAKY